MSTATKGASAEMPWDKQFNESATEEDVVNCFRLFLGRNPSKHEWPGHVGAFVGKPLGTVISVYLNSPEFKSRKLITYSIADIEYIELDGYGIFVSKSDLAVGIHIRSRHEYEPQVTQAFKNILKPGMRVIDVGANIGWFSCLSSHLVGPAGRVIAIEAGEVNSKLLMMSRLRNRWEQLSILCIAASDRFETLLYSANSSNGFVSAAKDIDEIARGEPIAAMPLSKLLEDGEAWHLIKIDVEGYEYKVIQGLEDTIRRHKPFMLVEFAPESIRNVSGIDGTAFLRHMVTLGYSVTVLSAGVEVDCNDRLQRVLSLYDAADSDHLDLLLKPRA